MSELLAPVPEDKSRQEIITSGVFTPDELASLDRFRTNFRGSSNYLERVIDVSRLEFARWLVEHGKLDEWSTS